MLHVCVWKEATNLNHLNTTYSKNLFHNKELGPPTFFSINKMFMFSVGQKKK